MKDSASCTELDLLGEERRRGAEEREDHRDLGIARGKPREPLAPADDIPPIADHPAEAVVEHVVFVALAAVERDALGMLAQPHQAEAEIGFEALLVEHQTDQRP